MMTWKIDKWIQNTPIHIIRMYGVKMIDNFISVYLNEAFIYNVTTCMVQSY